MGQERYRNGFEVTLQWDTVQLPLNWSESRVIFVNSMSDLFHEDIPESFIQSVFNTMVTAHWHIFQILTKRTERLSELASRLPWPRNVWMGVSVESPQYMYRIAHLQRVPAAVRFLSVEPLLAPIPRLPLTGVDWVILGGESGPGSRSMKAEWVRSIRDRCISQNVPFFFKQWGGIRKKEAGRTLDGRRWDQMPESKARRSKKSLPIVRDEKAVLV
jgi:protein gp37